jgi:C-terminal processing protease CtpA/Prc
LEGVIPKQKRAVVSIDTAETVPNCEFLPSGQNGVCGRASSRGALRLAEHHFAPKPGDLRIIALVNSHCGSDCEWMTEELASLPETLVAGVNTYGVCQMIQPGYSVLPHTGLRYRIALGRADPYGDNRSVDGYGLDVDVVIPDVDSLGRDSMRKIAAIVAPL